ncbi:Uncharacterised protein [uncultured archaeon]|nr:Uncharacterised protein [uncultured archaeon]
MEILSLFKYAEKLKFSDIRDSLGVRSNKLAYHLRNLTKRGILIKQGNSYSLSENSEYLIPYLTEKKSILPVVLILIGDSKKAFLYLRKKRPYYSKLSLPGGRILLGESLANATSRIMKENFNLETKFKKLNSISFEHIVKLNKVVHSFILFFVTAETKGNIIKTDILKNKKKIISSDYKLITKDANKETKIDTIISN